MFNQNLYQWIQHPYRNWFAAGVSLLLLLTAGLPLWDEWSRAKQSRSELLLEIEQVSQKAEALPQIRSKVESRNREIAEYQGIAELRLPEYRERFQQLIRDSRCRLLSSNIEKTHKQAWSPDISPFEVVTSVGKDKPKFEIASTSMTFTVEGELLQLDRLITDLQGIHDFAVLSKLTIQQPASSDVLKMDFEITLFHIGMTVR